MLLFLRGILFVSFLGSTWVYTEENQPNVSETDEKLYFTSQGKYKESDIHLNGGVTPSEKYRGFRSVHDPHPVVSDRICPITQVKANPECTWIIDGRSYQFCCPDCIGEFISLAKQQPELIKNPEEYVK